MLMVVESQVNGMSTGSTQEILSDKDYQLRKIVRVTRLKSLVQSSNRSLSLVHILVALKPKAIYGGPSTVMIKLNITPELEFSLLKLIKVNHSGVLKSKLLTEIQIKNIRILYALLSVTIRKMLDG